jgi:hypothetical protein
LFAHYWEQGNNLESILLISPVADLSEGYLLFRMQECRFTTPSQDVGMNALHGGWDTQSSALGLQTQQFFVSYQHMGLSLFISVIFLRIF